MLPPQLEATAKLGEFLDVRRLPFRDIDEISGRVMQGLRDLHCQSHAGRELCSAKTGELVRTAVQAIGCLLPSGAARNTGRVERGIRLAQVPTQPARLVRQRKRNTGRAGLRHGDEVLGWGSKPTQQEQCVLAT